MTTMYARVELGDVRNNNNTIIQCATVFGRTAEKLLGASALALAQMVDAKEFDEALEKKLGAEHVFKVTVKVEDILHLLTSRYNT
jgi:hypothetical protein